MRNTVKVIAIKDNNAVEVVPLITDACIGCKNSTCTKQGHPFTVQNPQKLPVYQGAIVKISASAVRQAVQAFFSLCLPLAAAIAGYILAPKICASIDGAKTVTEATRIAGVFIAFCATSCLVLIFTRFIKTERHASITEIITNDFDSNTGTNCIQ
ncbi:MAG: SoxR reducing system RseC family protein [Spirochaetaceae bacterium]|nr:SoxR reducing system RseC family protein [Spirochaetaceae bacterium]